MVEETTNTIGMLLGLIRPSEGEIIIDGKNLNEYSRDEILVRINFASPYIELPKETHCSTKIWRFVVGSMELII